MSVQVNINPSFYTQIKEVVKRTRNLEKEVNKLIAPRGELMRTLSNEYFKKLRQNLYSQKYPANPKKYNTRYADWKMKNYGFMDPWFLEGDLFKNIKVFEQDGMRMVGVPKGIYAGGKSWFKSRENQNKGNNPREITYYGYLIEHGSPSGKIPARPVFGPTLADFVKEDFNRISLRPTRTIFRGWRIRR
jgi:hypothetical protein